MRLLRETKDRVASQVAHEKYNEALKDAEKKLWDYANNIITNTVGEKFLQEVREDANHHFLNKAYSVMFITKDEIRGWTKRMKTVSVPVGVFIPNLISIEVTESQMEDLQDHSNKIEDIKSLRNSLQRRLRNAMDDLKTYNRITESLPELKPYLDEEIKKRGIDTSNVKKLAKESITDAKIENLRKELKNDKG